MMNNEHNDHENDEFFARLKKSLHMPEESSIAIPPLTQEYLDKAREAAQVHRSYQLRFGPFEERLLPMAASDGLLRNGPLRIDSLGGEWSLTREEIPDDPDWQILKFKCRKELIPDLQGREVKIQIGSELFALGQINRNGVAEIEISKDIDMAKAIDVRILERNNPISGEE
ncbi:hypothetical protein [Nitrosomonas ureae]|uniref:Uncharacterized protein n=1 Tax=Nitrosomonas ureae TaxID=44577 RepID=A0A1H9FH57_9PROT|nr:hypothetical protein [Nitrosomonas ureae]SEQ37229.1 hypothetical protein SAMN05421510_104313 [Nitrosomonas ureae]